MGAGELLLPGAAIWARAPEKVLAVRTGWAEEEPVLAGRLLRAVWWAGRWLGQPDNRMIAAEILGSAQRLGVSADLIERALSGRMVMTRGGGGGIARRFGQTGGRFGPGHRRARRTRPDDFARRSVF